MNLIAIYFDTYYSIERQYSLKRKRRKLVSGHAFLLNGPLWTSFKTSKCWFDILKLL